MFFLVLFWWKEFELIRTVKSGGCFFKVETQFVSAVYNVKYLKMDCLVYGYIVYNIKTPFSIELNRDLNNTFFVSTFI